MRTPVAENVRTLIVADMDPDPSYLEQEGFEKRLASYNRGEWAFVGVKVAADVKIPHGPHGWIVHTFESPGLWGVEDDSDDSYFEEIAGDERYILREMLEALNVDLSGVVL